MNMLGFKRSVVQCTLVICKNCKMTDKKRGAIQQTYFTTSSRSTQKSHEESTTVCRLVCRTCSWCRQNRWLTGSYHGEMKRFFCLLLWNPWDMCERSCKRLYTHKYTLFFLPLSVIYHQRFVFRVTISLRCEAFTYHSWTTETLIQPDKCNCVSRRSF